jgi:GNAT superfamily N-acetyltransferase
MEECRPVVARLEDEPTSICGWACFGHDVVHYVFVRPRWQRLGIAKLLLQPFADRPQVFYTHKTRDLGAVRVPDNWIYNPYMALLAPKVA